MSYVKVNFSKKSDLVLLSESLICTTIMPVSLWVGVVLVLNSSLKIWVHLGIYLWLSLVSWITSLELLKSRILIRVLNRLNNMLMSMAMVRAV